MARQPWGWGRGLGLGAPAGARRGREGLRPSSPSSSPDGGCGQLRPWPPRHCQGSGGSSGQSAGRGWLLRAAGGGPGSSAVPPTGKRPASSGPSARAHQGGTAWPLGRRGECWGKVGGYPWVPFPLRGARTPPQALALSFGRAIFSSSPAAVRRLSRCWWPPSPTWAPRLWTSRCAPTSTAGAPTVSSGRGRPPRQLACLPASSLPLTRLVAPDPVRHCCRSRLARALS